MSRLQNASMSSYKALSDWCHLCSRFCLRKLITSNKIEEDMLHLHHHVVSTIKRPSLLTSWRSSLYWTNYFTDFVGNKVHNRPLLSLWYATTSSPWFFSCSPLVLSLTTGSLGTFYFMYLCG